MEDLNEMKHALEAFIKVVSFKATIFELNQDSLKSGNLSFFHNHLAFAKLAFLKPGEGNGKGSPVKSTRRGKKAAAAEDAEDEEKKSPPEFYNMYSMY